MSFIEGEIAHIDPEARRVIIARGDVEGSVPYDYLRFALGRRLATERVTGFFEHANHLLGLDGAQKFGEAIRRFRGGQVIIGQCPEARLPIPVYETAFAMAQFCEETGQRDDARITIVSPDPPGLDFGDAAMTQKLVSVLARERIQFLPDVPISSIAPATIRSEGGRDLNFDLLMLLPPFRGSSAAAHAGIADSEGYVNVDWTMRVMGAKRMYAVGDCVALPGPKLGHLAVNQAQVAAANLAAEIAGHEPVSYYRHEVMMVIDDAGGGGIFFRKDMWADDPGTVRHGRFWSWAKRIHEKYWEATHA